MVPRKTDPEALQVQCDPTISGSWLADKQYTQQMTEYDSWENHHKPQLPKIILIYYGYNSILTDLSVIVLSRKFSTHPSFLWGREGRRGGGWRDKCQTAANMKQHIINDSIQCRT